MNNPESRGMRLRGGFTIMRSLSLFMTVHKVQLSQNQYLFLDDDGVI